MRTRRDLLVALGPALLVVPLTSLAQPKEKVWRVGFLATRRPDSIESDMFGSMPRRLRELGYVEGKNLAIEWRFADGNYERLAAMAAELVTLKVDVIVAEGTPGIRAAQNATRAIPIVFMGGADLVASGFVKSLARPGGNTTGVSLLLSDTVGKQLELLIAMVPNLSRLAVLFNPTNEVQRPLLKGVQAAAEAKKVRVFPVEATNPEEIEAALSLSSKERSQALIWITDAFFIQQRRQIAELSLKYRLPAMTGSRTFADAGGLMAYGPNGFELYARVAELVDKIFKGANPGELPIEQPRTLYLVINRKTAKALGLTIPPELLLLADKVID